MSKLKEKKDIKMTIFIMVAGIALMVAGIYGVVSSRIDSREYKNSTDIQEISAVIHMLLTEKPIRENMKSVSGQTTPQKCTPIIK